MNKRMTISTIIIILAVTLVFGMVLNYRQKSEERPSETARPVVVKEIPSSQPTISHPQFETKTNLMSSWIVYQNTKAGYQITYPPRLRVDDEDKNLVAIYNPNNPEEKVVIIRQKDIPRVPLRENLIEDITVDGIPAKLYHDVDAKTGLKKIDEAIFDVPSSDDDIYIAGYGDTFNLMLSSFKLIK